MTIENQNEKVYLRNMLTKQDLNQIEKLVRKVVREEVEVESRSTREDLQSEIKLARMELSLRLDKIDDKIKNLEIRLSQFQTDTEKTLKRIASNSPPIPPRIC